MNPIESLRNSTEGGKDSKSKFPIKDNYHSSSNKREFLISVAKDIGSPHYPSLHLNIDENLTNIQIDRILYDGDLQDRLAKWKEEKDKMIVMAGHICNNNMHKFINAGGNVSIGLVLDNPIDKRDHNGFRVIEGNPIAEKNEVAFRALKGTSVYEQYIFDNVKGDNVLGVYDKLYYMIPEIRNVQTYTIVYVVKDSIIREVTLHDFQKYGNILTKIDLKVE